MYMKPALLSPHLLPFILLFPFFTSCVTPPPGSDKARALHERILTVDTHCDTPMRMARGTFDPGVRHDPKERGAGCVDFPRMKEGGLDAQFFAIFLGQGARNAEAHEKMKETAEQMIATVQKACNEHADLAQIALTPEDAYRLEKEGKRAIFLGMENGYPLGTDLSLVSHFYDLGIRYITLCHNGNNEICDSSTDRKGPEWNGLSPFGENVVAEMNRLGMIIDVSHVSDSTFYDVVRLSKAPVVASHSCCRDLHDVPRNMTDDMIRTLAKKGGVIQICFVNDFIVQVERNPMRDAAFDSLRKVYGNYNEIKDESVRTKLREDFEAAAQKYPVKGATLEQLVDHIDHAVKIAGVDHVGIGTDFDGGGGVEGAQDVSELPNITAELLRRGYSAREIEKIWGGNFMRVFREIVKTGQSARKET